MKAHHWSGSKVDLGLHCLYWARPEVKHPWRPPGVPAARGIAVHRASENYHKGKPLPALDADGAALWLSLRRWLEDTNATPTHVELALLYDVENDRATACETGDGERDYLNVTPMTIPMRLDLAWEPAHDDGPIVIDIKTGSRSNTSPAAENVQIATQALAFSRFVGWRGPVTAGLIFPLKTKVHDDRHQLAPDDLEMHAGMLYRRLRTIPSATPEKGSHCWRCPIGPSRDHRATCPAWETEEQETGT